MILKNEIWNFLPDSNNEYKVSNLGRVKSLKNGKDKVLKLVLKNSGYYQVSICTNKKVLSKRVHQLVALSFLKYNIDSDLVIDHINNIKTDNRLENLQVITHRENTSKDRKNKTSKYTGVCWDKKIKKWHSTISNNNKRIHLGFFKCELKAHYIYINNLNKIKNDSSI